MSLFARVVNALPTSAPFQRSKEVIFALAESRWYRRHPVTGLPVAMSTPRLVISIARSGAVEASASYTATVLENGLGVQVAGCAYQAAGVYRLTLSAATGRANGLRPLSAAGTSLTFVNPFSAAATTIDCTIVTTAFAASAIPDGGSALFAVEG